VVTYFIPYMSASSQELSHIFIYAEMFQSGDIFEAFADSRTLNVCLHQLDPKRHLLMCSNRGPHFNLRGPPLFEFKVKFAHVNFDTKFK
jgi:hypothetical protein